MTATVCDSLPKWLNVRVVNGRYLRGKPGEWEELFDYGGIRYHACLSPSSDGKGIQDEILLLLGKACEEYDDDSIDDYADECRRLIWPLVELDYASRSQSVKMDLSPCKAPVRIEGRTTVDGKLEAFSHERKLGYSTHPIPNTFPSEISTFPHPLVHRLERLDSEIFKVEYNKQLYCLKTVHSRGEGSGLKREISILQQCHHPNIITLHGIVVNEQNKVEGMLMELIPNVVTLDSCLNSSSSFSETQCIQWISQIESALQYLHKKSLVWGDAKPANILVRPNHDLVLVDFAGGATEGWVDWKNMNSVDGDLQGFNRIKNTLWGKVHS